MDPKNIDIEECFKYAAFNQKAFDDFYYDMIGLRSGEYCAIPRPVKWASRYVVLLPFIRLLSKLLLYFWGYCGFYVYTFGILNYKIIVKLFSKSAVEFGSLERKSIGFYVGDRSYVVLSRPELDLMDYWISPSGGSWESEKIIDCTDVLSYFELFSCMAMSIRAHKLLIKDQDLEISWQSYTLYSWMMMWAALVKLSPLKISMTDHHDRWAVLLDLYSKKRNASSEKFLLSLTQHGLEYESTYKRMCELSGSAKLPYLLSSVGELNLYDSGQFEIFSKYILSESIHEQCLVNYIGKRINLTVLESVRPSLLIVGHKACEETHLKLYDFLTINLSIDIYYKPHPTVSASRQAKNAGWNYIDDVNYFPRVSCVVSYPSTLAAEYEAEGVRTFIHSMSLSASEYSLVFNEIKSIVIHGMKHGF